MTPQARRSHMYLAAFMIAMLVSIALSGGSFTVLIALSLFYAIIFGVIGAGYQAERSDQHPSSLTLVVLISLLFAVDGPAQCTATWVGLAAFTKCTFLTSNVWLGSVPAIFAGLYLHAVASGRYAEMRIVSIVPDIAFGFGVMLALYGLLRTFLSDPFTLLTKNDLSFLWGNSIIHYLIILLFLVLLSHIVRCYLGHMSRSKKAQESGPQTSELLKEEKSLRWFVRVLIGALPLLGFLGTVFGITQAMVGLPQLFDGSTNAGEEILAGLSNSFGAIAIAFETTMLGLVASLITSILLSYVEKLDVDLAATPDSVST